MKPLPLFPLIEALHYYSRPCLYYSYARGIPRTTTTRAALVLNSTRYHRYSTAVLRHRALLLIGCTAAAARPPAPEVFAASYHCTYILATSSTQATSTHYDEYVLLRLRTTPTYCTTNFLKYTTTTVHCTAATAGWCGAGRPMVLRRSEDGGGGG